MEEQKKCVPYTDIFPKAVEFTKLGQEMVKRGLIENASRGEEMLGASGRDVQ